MATSKAAKQPKRNQVKKKVNVATATRFGRAARDRFLACIRKGTTVKAAATAAGIQREYAYQTRYVDPDFKKEWSDAEAVSIGLLEDMAAERCKHSDQLLMFLLRAKDPAKYNRGTHSAAKGGDTSDPAVPVKVTPVIVSARKR